MDRPSRFDKVYSLDEPDEEFRRVILEFLLSREASSDELKISKGLTCADLKEVVLLNQIQGLDFHIAVKRIREHHRLVAKQFAKRVPIGIRDSMDCDP